MGAKYRRAIATLTLLSGPLQRPNRSPVELCIPNVAPVRPILGIARRYGRGVNLRHEEEQVAEGTSLPPMTLDDWRGATLSRIRKWIEQADPGVVEERKWIKPTNPDGVPVWSHDGMICTGEIYKNHVKVTFARGASLKDPSLLFNSSLEGNLRRAIDVHEGEKIDEKAFKALIREAIALNEASVRRK